MARLTQWTPQARVITHQQTTNICMQSVHCQNCTHKMKLWNSNWAAWWIQIHKLKLNMLTVQQTTVQVVRALSLFDFVCVMWSVSGLWCCLLCLRSVFLCPFAAGISHLIWLFVNVPQQKNEILLQTDALHGEERGRLFKRGRLEPVRQAVQSKQHDATVRDRRICTTKWSARLLITGTTQSMRITGTHFPNSCGCA